MGPLATRLRTMQFTKPRRRNRVITSPGFAWLPRRGPLAALLAFVVAAGIADAQSPSANRIRILSANGVSIVGALIGIVDAGGNIVAEGMSNADGARSLAVPPGRYRVQVRRIGFEPFFSEMMAFPLSKDLILSVVDRAVSLRTVVVTEGARCRRIEKDAAALSTVWQEIAKALRSSQLTTEDLAGIAMVHTYEKEVGPHGKVISNQTRAYKVTNARPFGSIEPRLLSVAGYVNGNPTEGWHYYAPDETVLLSETFAATHCFRVVRDKKRAGQIGMSFEPVAGRTIADIAGVLWVEEQSSELREIRFRFVNVDVISAFDAGGRTHFRRMPSGAWIVDEWSMRFPKLEMKASNGMYSEIGYVENGGGIVQENLVAR